MAYTPSSSFTPTDGYTPSSSFTLTDGGYTPSLTAEFSLTAYTPSNTASFTEFPPDIGAVSVSIENSVYETATVSVTLQNDVYDSGFSSVTIQNDVVAGIGTVSATVQNTVYDNGLFSLTIENDIVHGIESLSVTLENSIFGTFQLSTGITSEIVQVGQQSLTIQNEIISVSEHLTITFVQRVYETGTISASIQNEVTETTYKLTTSVANEVYYVGSKALTINQSIYETSSSAGTTPAGTAIPDGLAFPISEPSLWSAKIILKGLDVSANLTGTVTVDQDQDSAAVASFTIKPTVGLVDLTQWVKGEVSVSLVKTDSAAQPVTEFPLFNGVVDVPVYDPQSRTTQFTCTDELQKHFEDKQKADIAESIQGFWSDQVFDEESDNWTYALDRLSTIPYSIHYDVNRVLVKTPWLGSVTPDFVLNEACIIDGSLSVEIANSRSITNQVDVTFNYQYDSFKEKTKRFGWRMVPDAVTASWNYGITPVNFQQVIDAATSDGWALTEAPVFTAWPPSGWYGGRLLYNVEESLVTGATFTVAKRYNQYVNEQVGMRIYSPKSITSLGRIADIQEYSMTVEYSDEAGQFDNVGKGTGTFRAELNTAFAEDIQNGVVIGSSYIGEVDVSFEYDTYTNSYQGEFAGGSEVFDLSSKVVANTREDLEKVVEVVQNLSKTDILRSHRGNSVTCSIPIDPGITRSSTVEIDTATVQAKGRVSQLVHTLNIDSGAALTEVTLAISRSTGVGIPDTDTPLDNTVVQPVIQNQGGEEQFTYKSLGSWIEASSTNLKPGSGMEAYYTETLFLVPLPEIPDVDIQEVTVQSDSEFIVDVPDEQLILNA